jgi:hypothetical protein
MKTHTITYYWPEGQKGPDDQAPRLHRSTWESKAAAQAALIALCGADALWRDDEGNACYHESEDIGCGGYCIEPIRAD